MAQLVKQVNDSSSLTLAPAESAKVVQATRVSDDDWRLTLEGSASLADRVESLVESAPEAAQCTCRLVGPQGRHPVRLEIGCRGSELLVELLEAVIDDHAAAHPEVRLLAMLRIDDSMRPRRIDVVVPSGGTPTSRSMPMWPGSLGLLPAQGF